MAKVFGGRWTARLPAEGAVVFLIGMRFNRWWRIDRWWAVFTAMPRMIAHLKGNPDAGMLGLHLWFGRTIVLLSYWRCSDDLIAFAAAKTAPHLKAWRSYNKSVGSDGTVGVWHETYLVKPGAAEAIYANMPRFGLAAATSHEQVTPATTSSRRRLADTGPS
jgi:Domain of unknown function (DUF4188)